MNVEMKKAKIKLQPLSLKDAPALIEKVFPAQKISAEAQKERKAVQSQTLTGLGSYWKGRKPLIMARAIVLAGLLPLTDNLEADLDIFEKLMGIDDAAFGRREPKLKASDVASKVRLRNPWEFFDYSIRKNKKDNSHDAEEIENLSFPVDLIQYPKISIRWKSNIDDAFKHKLFVEAMRDLSYEEKVGLCKRPEECHPGILYGPIWEKVNQHFEYLGIEVHSHEEVIEQLGILRYGHRPRVGDTFCGGGSIPFEAARLGCNVYASDLNPVACMLTWGALNIIGASHEKRAEIERAQQEVAEAVDKEIAKLGIEYNDRGDRAKAYLYCLESRCPETGWMVPMAPSWVVSKTRNLYAKLIPDYGQKRFNIEIISDASNEEMKAAGQGTVQDGKLVYELDGKVYRTSIRTLRGDFTDKDGNNRNKLRQWEKHDFKPRPDDIFQERLYCIQWITRETLDQPRKVTYFASVAEEDLERERKVEQLVEKNLAHWQEEGLVPDMEIEPGVKTNELIRTRGWRYWHHLFNPRQLIFLIFTKNVIDSSETEIKNALVLFFAKMLDWSSRLCRYGTGAARESIAQTFYNQALNTFFNFGVRSFGFASGYLLEKTPSIKLKSKNIIRSISADQLKENSDIFITDPPYADAINYHEITEFFIAWLRKNPPPPFDEWIWDSRRALAIKGTGEDFRRGMVEAYKATTKNMPENGLQCVMFTHQDTGVWSDMVSIFWAAGLRVVGAWYIATETSTALRDGGHVKGTITLVLRKRLRSESSFKQRLLPKIRREVQSQIDSMMRLNDEAKAHGKSVFNDSDLQMAGYAAALKVLTNYSEVDGRDVTNLALQPKQNGQRTVIDDIVEYASEIANNLLIPERLKELNPATWGEISGLERFYLRMLAIEQSGVRKLDNYQNFSKAFHVDYQPLMASVKPNAARLKGAKDFKPRELAGGDFGNTLLGELLMAIQELLNDKEPKVVFGQIHANLNDTYFQKREYLLAIAQYIHDMLISRRPEEAQKAEIIANQIRNEAFR
jgi:putative DNA methylase